MGLTFQQLEDVWMANGGSASYAPLMAAIAMAESGGNPTALNPTDNHGTQSSYGLWQISTGTHTAPNPNWADPNVNAQLAMGKLQSQGLGAWGAYSSGAYKRFLPSPLTGVAGSGQYALGGSEVAPGQFGQSPTGSQSTAQEGDWQLNAGLFHIGIPRSMFRKSVGAVVLVGGGAVMLLGTGWIAKGSAIGQVAKPLSKALGAPGQLQASRREARHSEARAMMEGRRRAQERADSDLSATRDRVGEQRRKRQQQREQSYLSARAEGEAAADAAGPF